MALHASERRRYIRPVIVAKKNVLPIVHVTCIALIRYALNARIANEPIVSAMMMDIMTSTTTGRSIFVMSLKANDNCCIGITYSLPLKEDQGNYAPSPL
jgi:hypothetical protein